MAVTSSRLEKIPGGLICQFSLLSFVIFASDLNSNCLILIQFCHDIFDACVSGVRTDVADSTNPTSGGEQPTTIVQEGETCDFVCTVWCATEAQDWLTDNIWNFLFEWLGLGVECDDYG